MEAERLRDLERDVREMADCTNRIVQWINSAPIPHATPKWINDVSAKMRAIALRLTRPRAFDKIAEGLNEALAVAQEKAEPARFHAPPAPTDEPSGDDLRAAPPLAPPDLTQVIQRTFDEWMANAESFEAWSSRLAREIAGLSAPSPATVEEIARIIRKHVHDSPGQWGSWADNAAREIAARIPAPAVPAEIVERAKAVVRNLPSTPHMDLVRGSYPTTLAKLEFAADFARTIAAQSAPAPDPRAAGEREA